MAGRFCVRIFSSARHILHNPLIERGRQPLVLGDFICAVADPDGRTPARAIHRIHKRTNATIFCDRGLQQSSNLSGLGLLGAALDFGRWIQIQLVPALF